MCRLRKFFVVEGRSAPYLLSQLLCCLRYGISKTSTGTCTGTVPGTFLNVACSYTKITFISEMTLYIFTFFVISRYYRFSYIFLYIIKNISSLYIFTGPVLVRTCNFSSVTTSTSTGTSTCTGCYYLYR